MSLFSLSLFLSPSITLASYQSTLKCWNVYLSANNWIFFSDWGNSRCEGSSLVGVFGGMLFSVSGHVVCFVLLCCLMVPRERFSAQTSTYITWSSQLNQYLTNQFKYQEVWTLYKFQPWKSTNPLWGLKKGNQRNIAFGVMLVAHFCSWHPAMHILMSGLIWFI